jgi:hypothetical protein
MGQRRDVIAEIAVGRWAIEDGRQEMEDREKRCSILPTICQLLSAIFYLKNRSQ